MRFPETCPVVILREATKEACDTRCDLVPSLRWGPRPITALVIRGTSLRIVLPLSDNVSNCGFTVWGTYISLYDTRECSGPKRGLSRQYFLIHLDNDISNKLVTPITALYYAVAHASFATEAASGLFHLSMVLACRDKGVGARVFSHCSGWNALPSLSKVVDSQ